jgi:type II secretory pathway component PulF
MTKNDIKSKTSAVRPKRTGSQASSKAAAKAQGKPSKKVVSKKKVQKPARRSNAPTGINKAYIKSQLNQKKRLSTYRKIRKFINNNVSITAALDILYNTASDEGRKPKQPLAIIYDQWRQTVRDGKSFGEAIDGWVPPKDQIIIASGEAAGKLDIALENAAFIQESSKKISSAIMKGLAYPVLLLSMTIGFMFVVSRVMVPAFSDIKPIETWTGSGAQMASLAHFVDNYMIIALGVTAALITGVTLSLPRMTGRLRAKLDKFPPYSFYRLSAGSGFLLSVSALISAGVSIPQGLKIIRKTANPWYRERIDGTLSKMGGGKTFGEALYETKLDFPDKEAVTEIRVYATLDGFDESLSQLGAEWLDDSVERITQQATLLRSGSILFMALVFGWIASGIFSLQQQVTSGL